MLIQLQLHAETELGNNLSCTRKMCTECRNVLRNIELFSFSEVRILFYTLIQHGAIPGRICPAWEENYV